MHPDDETRVREDYRSNLMRGTEWTTPLRIRGKDGVYRRLLNRGVPIRDEHGGVASWIGLNLDLGAGDRVSDALIGREPVTAPAPHTS
jgi:PAS domain-containing protein